MKSIVDAKKRAKSISKKKNIKLKEALELFSIENNYSSWKDFKDSNDTFWYHKASPFLTQWFTNHKEAQQFQRKTSGFLLTYKGQYFVVDDEYIQFLGIDPEAPVWEKIQRDVSSSEAFDKMYLYLKELKLVG